MPKVSLDQKKRQIKKISKLRQYVLANFDSCEIMQDHESYFTLTRAGVPGNSGCYTATGDAPDKVKFYGQAKFPQRVLVWIAASSKGISTPFICCQNHTINSEV